MLLYLRYFIGDHKYILYVNQIFCLIAKYFILIKKNLNWFCLQLFIFILTPPKLKSWLHHWAQVAMVEILVVVVVVMVRVAVVVIEILVVQVMEI